MICHKGKDIGLMKTKVRQLCIFLMAAAVLLGMGGCTLFAKSFSYVDAPDSIYVGKNATIRASIISSFDKDYYSLEELAAVTKKQVLDFNERRYNYAYYTYDQMSKEDRSTLLLPVSFESITNNSGLVIIQLSYANGDTYSLFNSGDIARAGGTKVYTALMSRAVADQMISADASFVSRDGTQTVNGSEISDKEDYIVAFADYGMTVYGEHEIAYVSPNVTVLSENSAQISGNDGAYIIFK